MLKWIGAWALFVWTTDAAYQIWFGLTGRVIEPSVSILYALTFALSGN